MACLDYEHFTDNAAIESLLDRAFGPDRRAKTCERLRQGNTPALALVARAPDGAVVGTVRLWPVSIGGRHRALMLGPLAVDAAWRGERIGARLMRRALAEATLRGHGAVILVGDEPYYQRFGFDAAPTRHMLMPGPVDRARFLALELRPGALAGARGAVTIEGSVTLCKKSVAYDRNRLHRLGDARIDGRRRHSHVPPAIRGQATT